MSPMVSRPLTIEIALLGYLTEGPRHGYQIHRSLMEPNGLRRIWWLKQAQLYALLGKLEEAGYLSASIETQEKRPARRMFRLTPKGEEIFRNWLESPVERPRQMRQEFQVKLYFACREGREVCRRLIEEQRHTCCKWLAANDAMSVDYSIGQAHLWLTDQYRIGQIQAMLNWLDLCCEKLE